MNPFEDLVIQASNILDTVENYQFEIGRLSNEIVQTQGYRALEDFSKQIEENCGVRRSPTSLRLYAYVYKISNQLGLPKDILFSDCREIVFSSDPQKIRQTSQRRIKRLRNKKSYL